MKKILLLGGSSQQIIAIETAKKLGLYTILCDYLPDNPGQYHADKFYQTSTTDKKEILKVAQDENIDYIIAYASDPAAPTAAYVAEKLGLPGNPYESVNTLCNKDLFREFLIKYGFNTPRSAGFDYKEDVFSQINEFDFPIIIKPVDSSGSKGVTVLYDVKDLDKAINYAYSYSRCNRIIVEEFIEKKHPYLVGGDVFISNGKVIQWGLLNCHRDNSVNPLVPVGKSYPVELTATDLQHVKDTIQHLVDNLKIRFGAMNVELIIGKNNKVYPIDIGPRNGGNMIPDLLGYIFHCDVVEMTIRAAMGQTIEINSELETCYYATHNLHSDRNGILKSITFSEEIERYIFRKNIYLQKGDKVSYFSNSAFALGIIFMKFDNQEVMNSILRSINTHIQIQLEDV